MANTLISGPSGAGKSKLARELLAQVQGQGAIVDFQLSIVPCSYYGVGMMVDTLSVTLLDAHLLALAEYVRRAMITGARDMDIEIIATNSDGSPQRSGVPAGPARSWSGRDRFRPWPEGRR